MKYIILLLLIGCGSGEIKLPKDTDPTFTPYIHEFQKAWGKDIKTPINFGDMDKGIAGVCHSWTNGHTEIEIDKDFWDYAMEYQKEVLIFHELGHCELDRRHDFGTVELDGNTCPSSVMRTPLFHIYEIFDCYELNRDYYIEELFK